MSATAHTADPAHISGPLHDRAAAYAARLLGFVHKLIDFGIQLAVTAQRHPAGDALSRLGVRFGTKSTQRIIARIALALRRAAKLEQRLAGGRLVRLNPAQAAAESLCPYKPRAPRSESQPRGPNRIRLPGAAKIAAWLRHDPFEMVLMQICRELGLTHSNELQTELDDILAEHPAKPAPENNTEDTAPLPPDQSFLPDPPLPAAPLRQPAPQTVSVATTATGPP